jgi:hypothetical protein
MNSKLLFAATIAISVLSSTVALADEAAPVTRDQVKAELAQAVANNTLQRTDYDADRTPAALSTRTRADVAADLVAAKTARKALRGPDANRTYNQYGTDVLAARSTLTRAEVKEDVLEAAAAGTLQRTDYDDAAVAARRANQHTAAPARFAQRVKTLFSRQQG